MVTTHPSAFGSLLKRYRIAAGLTQEELAERARLSARAVSDLERGARRSPYRDTVQQLADALEMDAEDRRQLEQAVRADRSLSSTESAPAGEKALGTTAPVTAIQTVLIADIRGYTRFTEEQGDEAAARLARRFAEISQEVVLAHDGEVIELRGDEALCVFPSARSALHCSLALQHAFARATADDPGVPLQVGIGLDAGEVVPVHGGYRGHALNLAARLCALAPAGAVLAGDGVIHLAGKTGGIAVVERGEAALKGFAHPIRVIQVVAEGEIPGELPPLQANVSPATTVGRQAANLPLQATPFIGRERELGEIVACLQDPQVRLLTLTGPGGTGKTRLALEAASSLLPHIRDGVVAVFLASLTDPSLVPSAIAEALEVKERPGTNLLQTVTDYLKEKRLLLVLDNYEHLLDAADVGSHLLGRCPGLQLLVTSRTPLHISGEREYAVPPLALPELQHLPDLATLSQYDALVFFVDRARAVKADFSLTDENAASVVAICRKLDGLPLAIELAAARIKLFPPRALLSRLSQSLQILTGGARDKPPRQQTLRGTIDWSYSLLSEDEQMLLARLSVFAGGCTFDAVEGVCDPEGAVDLLEGMASLVDKSLLRQEGEDEPRFVMLETIREYAAERLGETGVAEQLKEAHTQHYLVLAEEAAHGLDGQDQSAWLERLESERDNLRAALQWARDRGDLDRGLHLAVALRGFWMVRGPLAEGRRWLEDLAAGGGGTPALRAAAFFTAGKLAAAEGHRRAAAELFERSLALYRELGDRRGSANAVGALAVAWSMAGDGERAADLVRQSEIEGREIGDLALLAASLGCQAALTMGQGDPQRTRDLGEESLALYRRLEDGEGIAFVLRVLVEAAFRAGDSQRARALTDELLALLRRLPLDSEKEEWLEPLAYYARLLGDYEYATRIVQEFLARAEAVGDRRIVAHARGALGLLAREQGDYGRSAALFGESVAALQEIGDLLGRSRALVGLSDVARDQGDAGRVVALCEESLTLLRETDDLPLTAYALHNLGLAAWYQGDHVRAERLLAESLSMFQGQGSTHDTVEIRTSIGLLALDRGQYDRAGSLFTECLSTARAFESRWIMGTLLDGMAGVAAGTGQAERAALLAGAAEALRVALGTPRRPAHESLHNRCVASAMSALGQERFLQMQQRGRAMLLDQALAIALNEITVP